MRQFAKCAALSMLAVSLMSVSALAGDVKSEADATDALRVGQGVVCDTAQQVERFTALIGDSSEIDNAIKTVNTEAKNPLACGLVMAAFVQGNEVTEIRHAPRSMKVVEITILAVPVGNQWQFVSPVKQYAAFPVKGTEI